MIPELALFAAIPPSAFAGSCAGVVVTSWWRGHRLTRPIRRRRRSEDLLTRSEQEAIQEQFGAHAVAVTDQMSQYADALADGDPMLRARLHQLAQHVRSKV